MNISKGFTLIELMIVAAVISIIAVIAIPQYTQYVIKSNRSAAQAFMMDVASREKQYLIDARSYAIDGGTTALAQLSMSTPANVSNNYTLTVTVPAVTTVPSFTVTATPIAGKSQANDGTLILDDVGNKSPLGKW